jgi:FkbM family methyltransferase
MKKRAKRTTLSHRQRLWRRFRNYIDGLTGRDLFFPIDVRRDREAHGKLSGGWFICPAALPPKPVIYSLGVGFDLSFDESILKRYPAAELHAFDPTPSSIEWVAGQRLDPRLRFHDYGVAGFNGELTLYAPDRSVRSYSMIERDKAIAQPVVVPVKRLVTIMGELGHQAIDVLKMDIEGAEYGVIGDMLDNGIRPSQLLVEFHHRFKSVGFGPTKAAVGRLREAGYRIFYVSHTAREYGFIHESALAGTTP